MCKIIIVTEASVPLSMVTEQNINAVRNGIHALVPNATIKIDIVNTQD